MKPRTTPADRRGAESVEGTVEGRARTNACPGPSAGTGMSPTASAHGSELYGPPKPRTRLTFDRSPVRESRTPGSARGAGGNSRSYRDQRSGVHPYWRLMVHKGHHHRQAL